MEQTLNALSGLALKAIPTVLLFIFLYFYIKSVLFGPIESVLKQRDELTAGARLAAESSLTLAEAKQAEYERKFAEARGEVYKLQEEARRKWLEDQSTQVSQARERMEASVRAAKEEIARESASAREQLGATASELAEEIASTLLARGSGNAA